MATALRSAVNAVAPQVEAVEGILNAFRPERRADELLCPLGVITCGGRGSEVFEQLCALSDSRFGSYMDVLCGLVLDTDVESLSRFPEGMQCRLGERTSAPDIAKLMASPIHRFIADRVVGRNLVKSGRQTHQGSKQVPAAPYSLALYEHQQVYQAIQGLVNRVADLPASSHYTGGFATQKTICVLGSDNGAVSRGTSRHVCRLVRKAITATGKGPFTVFHLALWGANYEGDVPSPLGAAAGELGGAVETILAANDRLPLPRELDLDQKTEGAATDYNIVLSGLAFADEGQFKQHAAGLIDTLRSAAGQKLVSIWRN